MKTLYFNLKNGISGDMAVGALLDMQVMPFDEFNNIMNTLNISNEFELTFKRTEKFKISGGDFDVIDKNAHLRTDGKILDTTDKHMHNHADNNHHEHCDDDNCHKHDNKHAHGRHLNDIIKIIESSGISKQAKELSLKIFENLAVAESAAHNKDKYEIHFHEVGAVDSIADIVGFSVLYTALNVDCAVCSYVNLGRGTVKCEHGILNVPAPAVLKLSEGMPVYCDDAEFEMTTPTGVAILKTVISNFCNEYSGKLLTSGIGFGKRDIKVRPNALNIMLFEDLEKKSGIVEINTNIDNTTAEDMAFCARALFEAGALDVCFSPIFMKKFRPGYKLEVLCDSLDLNRLSKIIFDNTNTIGLRYSYKERIALERSEGVKKTKYGNIRTKVILDKDAREERFEYDDLEELCIKNNLSIKEGRKL